VLGAIVALGAPVGLLVTRALESGRLPTPAWALAELEQLAATYAYVTISSAAVLAVLGGVLGRWFDRVRLLSITDPLTGLFNRRHFEQRLATEMQRGRRHGHLTCVLCADVDRLKAINDGRGHGAGDHALVALGHMLSRSVRAMDVVARVGGDEFAVLMPETSAVQALALSQRILTEIARHADPLAGDLAVSIGIAELGTTGNADSGDLMAAADAALYRAKTAGGARAVVVALGPPTSSRGRLGSVEAAGTA
jgi:diguanylate cyclase (GGDEF)-like protein